MAFPTNFKFEKPKINPDEIPGRRDLVEFFKKNGMEMYLEMFPKTVSFPYFKTMGEDDFIEYGVATESDDMLKLLDAVRQAVQEEEDEDQRIEEEDKQKAAEAQQREVCICTNLIFLISQLKLAAGRFF